MIRFLQRKQIDEKNYDAVIESSKYETVYPYSWYLDSCADSWGVFVLDDYECVMPVVFRKRLGLKYIYMPRLCQQLGVYSGKIIDPAVVRMFLFELGKKFKLGEYSFSEGNLLGEEEGFEVKDSSNYILPLNQVYEVLLKNYTENCRRNVKKAYQVGFEFSDKIELEEIVILKKSIDIAPFDEEHDTFLLDMFSKLKEKGRIKIYGVKLDGHLCAAAIFAFSDKRMHYLLSLSTEVGKLKSGMFMVIDSLIQLYAEKELTLDFEGSNIPSIARFFRGFGGKPQIYQGVSIKNTAGKLHRRVRDVKHN